MRYLAVVCLVLLMCSMAGCAQSARHDYVLSMGKLVMDNNDGMLTLGLEAATSAKAKAAQDEKRLDDALMLEIDALAQKTFETPAARQAAVLALVQKYKTSVVEVKADVDIATDRAARVKEFAAANQEAVLGLLALEARTWANGASTEDLVNKAITGLFTEILLKPKAATGGAK